MSNIGRLRLRRVRVVLFTCSYYLFSCSKATNIFHNHMRKSLFQVISHSTDGKRESHIIRRFRLYASLGLRKEESRRLSSHRIYFYPSEWDIKDSPRMADMGLRTTGKLWMIRAVFIFWIAIDTKPVNGQLREYVVTPNFPEDSEPKRPVTMPDNPVAYFKSFTKGIEYVGLLQAGRAEFPWVVDLENNALRSDTPDEAWAVGNLVNFQYVMTTCKAIYHLSGDRTIQEVRNPQIRILFCTNYLQENYKRYGEDERDVLFWVKSGKIVGGVRKSKKVITHDRCKVRTDQAWDMALIKMDNGIPPSYYPVIAYMPTFSIQGSRERPYTNYDYTKKIQPEDNEEWSRQEAKKLVCYIASFGKSFVSNVKNYVIDYKVKYRVYWTKMQDCEAFLKWICEDAKKDPACSKGLSSTAKNQLLCFISRGVQGAVCDHDRGAPLVCNGEVHGMVTRAAKFPLCNNRLPLYFLVSKFDAFQDFIDKYAAEISQSYPRK